MHFGHPDRVLFHLRLQAVPRYVKIAQPNPVPSAVPGEPWRVREGDYEAALHVVPGSEGRFAEALEGVLLRAGVAGEVEWVTGIGAGKVRAAN